MSICPDKIVFSEYVDGELPSPWKEKLEAHISKCSDCSSYFETYKKISESMKAEGKETIEAFDYDASFEKLKVKLNRCISNKKLEKSEDTSEKSFWQRSVRLPAPIIAAAALILVFLPAFAFFLSTFHTNVAPNYATYPAFQVAPRFVRTNKKNTTEVNFNSGVTDFLRFYLPNNDDNGTYRVMAVPATIDLEQYSDFFNNWSDIEEIDKLETKSPEN